MVKKRVQLGEEACDKLVDVLQHFHQTLRDGVEASIVLAEAGLAPIFCVTWPI